MPVVDLETPTLCLVGAPNVGKSSLVRILSTGKPEVVAELLMVICAHLLFWLLILKVHANALSKEC